MRLKLNRTLRAALIAAVSAVGFTTFGTGTIAVATGAALLAGQQAQAETITLTMPPSGVNNGGHGNIGAAAALTNFANSADGGYMFNAGGAVGTNTGTGEGILITDGCIASVNLCPRAGAGGSGEVIVLSGTTDLANKSINALTLSLEGSSTAGISGSINLTLAVLQKSGSSWSVQKQQAGTLTLGGGTTTLDLALDAPLEWDADHKVVAMMDNTTKRLSGANGNIYTLNNIQITAQTVTVGTSTWQGTDGNHSWVASNFSPEFTSGGNVVFGGAGFGTVSVDEAVTSGKVSVSGAPYTFELNNTLTAGSLAIAADGSLSLTGTNTMAVAGEVAIADGGSLTVGADVSLKVAGGAKELMMSTAVDNKGTFVLATNVSLGNGESTRMGGTLAIQGATVTLGSGEGNTASIASYDHVSLDGAQITVNAQDSIINGVSVATGKTGTIKVEDMQNHPKTVALNGVTQVDGTLNLTNNWNSSFTIAQLSGAGTLNQPAGGQQEMILTINSLEGFSGTLSLKHNQNKDAININTGTTAVNFNTLELAIGGHTANFTLGADTGITLVKLTSGTLALSGADTHTLTLGGLEGSATITGLNNLVLDVTSGSHEYTGTLTVAGQITKTGEGSQTIGGTALNHTILAQGGTLVLNGDYAIDHIAESSIENTTVDYEGNVSDNGFHKSSGTITVYSGEGMLNLDAAHFMYGTTDVTDAVKAGDGKYTLSESIDKGTVYVTKGSLDIANYKTDALTTVELSDGTMVNMDAAVTVGMKLAEGASATVNATAATTLSSVAGMGNGQLSVTGTELVTLGSAVTGNKVVVDNGKIDLGALTHTLSELSVTNGTVAVQGVDSANGCISGTISIGESATFTTTGHHDVFGYHEDTATDKIVMRGAENKLAKLVLDSPNANSVTMTTDIEMHGFSVITSTKGDSDKGFNTYGCTISVDGVENSISVLDMRRNGVTITVAENGALEVKKVTLFGNDCGDGTILVKDGLGALSLTGASNLTKGLTINNGSVEIGGAATVGNLSGAGDLVVTEGGSLNVTGTVTGTNITVQDGGTIAGGVDATNVGIAADATATFNEGIINSGVTFSADEGVQVYNKGEDTAVYGGIGDDNMQVTADVIVSEAGAAVTVENEVVVAEIVNYGEGPLTLTHVDTEALQSIGAYMEGVTLQNVGTDPIVLKDITLLGTTVAVYQGTEEVAAQEGTVTITDTLFAGGSTLLANLEMADGSMLNVNGGGNLMALTLGSQFTIADGALVKLDDATLAAIAGLENIGDTVILIKQLEGSELTTNLVDGDWSRTHFDLSSITGADYQLFVQDGQIGLVKSSMVPEPTTGTLSLLALAALAARRRRK